MQKAALAQELRKFLGLIITEFADEAEGTGQPLDLDTWSDESVITFFATDPATGKSCIPPRDLPYAIGFAASFQDFWDMCKRGST